MPTERCHPGTSEVMTLEADDVPDSASPLIVRFLPRTEVGDAGAERIREKLSAKAWLGPSPPKKRTKRTTDLVPAGTGVTILWYSTPVLKKVPDGPIREFRSSSP